MSQAAGETNIAECVLRATPLEGSIESEEESLSCELHRLRAMLHLIDSNAIVSAGNALAVCNERVSFLWVGTTNSVVMARFIERLGAAAAQRK